MNEMQVKTTDGKQGKLEVAGVTRVIILIAFALIFGLVLFLAAGRLDWLEGWIFSGAFLAYIVFMSGWGIHNDPELLNERGRAFSKKNVKEREKSPGAVRRVFAVGDVGCNRAGRRAIQMVWCAPGC